MEKCKTCVYWRGNDTSKQGVCDAIDDISGEAYMELYMSDGSGLVATFITSPEFGCSLHKAKEDGK